MIRYPTLAKYLIRLYTKQLLLVSIVILFILIVSNAFDVLQRFKSTDISPSQFWLLISYKVPYLFNEVSIMICFIATLLFIQDLRKNNELIIILSNGLDSWRIFIMPVVTSFFFGVMLILILNPIGVYGLKKNAKLEALLTGSNATNFVISPSGAFFYEKYMDNNRIIQAKSIIPTSNILNEVTVLVVDSQNNLLEQIDAIQGKLEQGMFVLTKASVTSGGITKTHDILELKTNLSIANLILRFDPPEMILLWNMSSSINEFLESGLAVTRYQLYYNKQLLKPLAMVALSLVACWFVSFNSRDRSNSIGLIYGLFIGIISYFLLEISFRLLAYSGVSPFIANLLPIMLIILISNFVILHFQEA